MSDVEAFPRWFQINETDPPEKMLAGLEKIERELTTMTLEARAAVGFGWFGRMLSRTQNLIKLLKEGGIQ